MIKNQGKSPLLQDELSHHDTEDSESTVHRPDRYRKSRSDEFEINMNFVCLYAFTLGINGICVAQTTGGANQTSTLFAAKFDWTEEETRFNNSLINFAS